MESSNFKLRYASLWDRLLAGNIDLVLQITFFHLFRFLPLSDWLVYVICMVFSILYFTVFESTSWGATPGKKLVGIRVLLQNRNPADSGRILLRSILKFLSLFLIGVGYLIILFDRKKRALHDCITGSVVVFQRVA